MATTKADTSHDEGVSPGGLVYDGFISYSHAADDLLAPRLQAGLQRFAKPWWKRRALRIFRDESSLSANPHLWASITDALDQSGWFVLLLSAEAAESPWVNNEVEYWLEHKDADRIIPVLTDGDFTWSDGDFISDAAPPALQGAFADEPRWVDLRFGHTDEQLDLNNPEFSGAVADIASAIRGIPKEELASEEVRQHRRTVRTAWAAGIALLALVVLAGAAAIYANGQRSEANQQRIAAEESAASEAEARADAETAAEAEGVARADAEEQADVAKSRELAASAVSVLDDNPELSMLLALESIEATPRGAASSGSGVLALRDAMQSNQLLARIPVGEESQSWARITGGGSTVFIWYPAEGTLSAVDVDTGAELWTHQEPEPVTSFGSLGLSPDETLVVFSLNALPGTDGQEDQPSRIVVLNAADGAVKNVLLRPGPCPVAVVVRNGFSPDGRWLMVGTGGAGCEAVLSDRFIALYDTETWEETHRLSTAEGADSATFSAATDRVLVSVFNGPVELRSFPELELIGSLGEASGTSLSPDGTLAVLFGPTDGGGDVDVRPRVVDAMSGQQLFYLDAVDDFTAGEEFIFSPDGSKIVVTTRGHDYVFDATNGRRLADLGEPGFTSSAAFTADGSQLLTALIGSAVLWDIGGTAADVGVPIELAEHDAVWFNQSPVAVGPDLAVRMLMVGEFGTAVATAVMDLQTGAVTGEIAGKGAQLPDGRFIVQLGTPEGAEIRLGPVVVWDPENDTTIQLTDCSAIESSIDHVNPVECPRGEPLFAEPSNDVGVVASIDGSFVAAESYAPPGVQRRVRVWDPTSSEVLAEFDVNDSEYLYGAGPTWTVSAVGPTNELVVRSIPSGAVIATLDDGVLSYILELSADASLLYVADWIGGVWVYDTSSWEVIANWQTHDAQHRGIALSPDGNRLATTAEDNFVKVWDVSGIRDRSSVSEPLPLLDRIPAPKPSDAAWLADNRLVVFLADDARWLEVSLSVDELVAAAQLRLTRSFTEGECATYQVDPCPTLEEINNR